MTLNSIVNDRVNLTILSIIAFCDSEYKVELTKDEIENSETISGLKELIKSNMKNSLNLNSTRN